MDKKIIHSVFEHTVEKYSSRTAIESEDERISYGDLNIFANRIAHLLQLIGAKNERIVNVIVPSSIQLIGAMLATFKTGCIYLPMDLSFSQKRLIQVFKETYDGIIITTDSLYRSVITLANHLDLKIESLIIVDSNNDIKLFNYTKEALHALSFIEKYEWSQNPVAEVNGDSSNYIFYTSGSTGDGKAILGKNVSLSHFIHWEIKEFGIDETFRISHLTAATFDASFRDVFTALVSGSVLCIPATGTKNNPEHLLKWIVHSKISLIHCVPSLFRVLTKQLQVDDNIHYNLEQLKYIILAGELLYARDILNWWQLAGDNIQLVNFYGATETTLIKTFYRISEVSENPACVIPVGVPISNTSVAIINNNEICKIGTIGEIYIKTPFTTKGYYKNELLTSEAFVQNPLTKDSRDIVYKTGDLGRYLKDGNIEVLGRLDNQVKVNGIRAELSEIEKAIMECGNVTGAIAKAHRTDDNLVTLIAYYTGEEVLDEVILDKLEKLLNPQLIPSYFIYMKTFPLNINGKVDRKALPIPEDVFTVNDVNFEQPEGELENKLALLWVDILGLKRIGRHTSFFSVGGHSLRAIQLISRISKEFNVSLRIVDIFNRRTISDLARLISNSVTSGYNSIAVVKPQSSYALSSSQYRLWILSQLIDGSIAYNIPGVYLFEGELNRDALSFAFDSLIERHEILRTLLKEDEQGTVRQYIQSTVATGFKIAYRDLRGLDQQQELLDKLVHHDNTSPFDLSTGPLLRAGLYQVADDKWMFTYVMHHIVSDGWSMGVLMKDLLSVYNSYAVGKPNPLSELRIQYKDYATWQQEQLTGAELQLHKRYWLNQFSGSLPVLELPGDKVRPSVKTYNGGMINRVIGDSVSKRLKALSQEEGSTLFMGLLAVVNALLYKYTNQEDIIIGSPIAGREHVDLEDQIGFYVNTIALRIRLSGTDNFKTLLQRVREVTLAGYEHQVYPFDELVNDLQLQRDMSRHPLFDVVVVLQNTEIHGELEEQYLNKLKVSSYGGSPGVISKFDLTFNFIEMDGHPQMAIEYNSDVYDRSTIERMGNHFEQLLERLIEDPSAPIASINYLNDAEKHQLLVTFNETVTVYPKDKTIIELFEEQVSLTPACTALKYEDKMLNYQQVNELANQLGTYLRKNYQLQPDEPVAVKLERSEWLIISILGILKSGAAYMLFDPEYPQGRIDYIIADSRCRVLIDKAELDKFKKVQNEYEKENIRHVNSPQNLAYIIYTSGSTGNPKGVMVEHASVVRLVKSVNFVELTGNEILLSTGAVSFDAVTFEYWGMLLNGGQLVLCREKILLNFALLAQEIKEARVNTMWFTSGWLNQLVEKDIDVFNGLTTILAGGDTLSPFHINALLARYPELKIINGYGPTENTCFSLTYTITTALRNIPIGKPISNSTAYILNDACQLLPIGIIGEICMGGAGLARGYLNNPALTADKFIDHPFKQGEHIYRSGDLGKWLPDGNIAFIGRKDDQVKIRGYRVEPGEIESALQQQHEIESAVVLAKTNEFGVKEMVAYVVSKKQLNILELRSALSNRLPVYMLPSHFVQLDKMPLTTNGKVDRKNLPEPAEYGMATGIHYMAARNEIEARLVSIYEEVLKKESVGIQDDFFILGGDSIKSIQVASRLKQQGYAISIQSIMLYPVIADLVQHVKPVSRMIDQATVKGVVPLGPIQQWFLENEEPDKHHYNQSILLQSHTPLSAQGIQLVLDKIMLHHDALRMTFHKATSGWVQENKYDQTYQIEIIDLITEDSFKACSESIQSSINLENGPLFKIALFKGEKQDRLLLTAHHLVLDGVSWRILLEDLSTLYHQYIGGYPLSLPAKTDSFKYFQEQQLVYAQSAQQQEEESYWSAIESANNRSLPLDHPEGTNLIKESCNCSYMLDKSITHQLLTQCYKAYRTEINDILLTALHAALYDQFGLDKLLITLEGHGREDIGVQMDLNRTVGWFTSIYPVFIDKDFNEDIIRQLIKTKELLHRVPKKGIGYGLLRYRLKKNYSVNPEITFNYLGDFGSGATNTKHNQLFEFSKEDMGKLISGERERDALLNVAGIIVDNRLHLTITYSNKQFSVITIEKLLSAYRKNLQLIIEKLSPLQKEYMTPVDLTYQGLNVDQWINLNRTANIADVYPLSPLQEGMYYHWLSDFRGTAFFEQMSFRLQGHLNEKVLIESYQRLISRHAILRTFFRQDLSDSMLQVVQKEVNITFINKDISKEKDFSIAAYKAADKARGFDLESGSQMRLSVLTLGDNTFEFIWSHHHILMDGWCVGILIKEFFHIYYSLAAGSEPALGRVYPYSAYLKWLNKADKQQALQYWNNYLAGIHVTTGIPKLVNLINEAYDPRKVILTLDGKIRASIRALCAQLGVTENIFVQAVWGILLSKYNNTEDVIFGAVVSGRPSSLEGVEEMIGLFINTIPVLIQIKEHQVFHELLLELQQQSIASSAYHYSPLVEVQAQSVLGRNLFDHVMVFENYPVQQMVKQDMEHSAHVLTLLSSDTYDHNNYDLSVRVVPRETIQITFSYNANVYEEVQMKRLQDHLFNLIEQIVENASLPITTLNCFNEEEQSRLSKQLQSQPSPLEQAYIRKQLSAYLTPSNDIEAKLVKIWEDILQCERIGVKDNFFDLGGHSLKVTRLSSKIYKTFHVKIGVLDLFTLPILEQQASLIQRSKKVSYNNIQPVGIRPSYLLSSSQHRLWILSQFEEGNISLNIPGLFVFEGMLDALSLERAFYTVIVRHEILRTVFREDEHGNIAQYIHMPENSGFTLCSQDLRLDATQHEKLNKLITKDLETPFNLMQGPLLRANLWRIEENKWIFSCVMHHIISDDWSMQILVKELLIFYNLYKSGNDTNPLPALHIQYKDYAAWQQQFISSGALNEHKKYWRSMLSGELPVLNIQTGRPRPTVKTYRGDVIDKAIGADLSKSFKILLQDQGTTLFMGLLATANVLLHTYTRLEDIIIGSPVAGRDHTALEGQMGFYINTLALRTRFSEADSFVKLLHIVRQVTLGAYEYQLYPFDELTELLNVQRDPSRNFLFDAWLVLHNIDLEGKNEIAEPEALKITRYEAKEKTFSKFDVLFSFVEMNEQLFMTLEFNTDILTKREAKNMCEQLEYIMEQVVKYPSIKIFEIAAMFDNAEKENQYDTLQKIRSKNLSDLQLKQVKHAK